MTTATLNQEEQPATASKQLLAGRFWLRSRIGRGRLGEIYGAEDEDSRGLGVEHKVAVQLLADTITRDNALFNKLKLGYTLLRSAAHPNIVSYLDFGYDGKFGYLAMERLEGASLRFIIDDASPIPLEEVNPVIRAVGDALQFLHAKSIVHGQVTAENVFVTDELDVRLLDVVPLHASEAALGDVAANEPVTRPEHTDDVYGLACLAYEMLTGKHPFNFHTRADAESSGLVPARIESLPDRQWQALCRALSFDQEPRSVTEFLRDFDVKGTERLRTSADAASPQASELQPAPTGVSGEDWTGSTAPVPIRAVPAERRKRKRRLPSLVLLLVLAGLTAWYFLGQPRDDVARLVEFVDARFGVSIAGSDRLPTIADNAPAREADDGIATVKLTSPDSAAIAETAGAADVPPESSAAVSASTDSVTDGQSTADVSEAPARELSLTTANVTVPRSDGTNVGPPASDSPIAFDRPVVTASEGDGAARLAIRIADPTETTLFWWTSAHGALAEADYIAVDGRWMGFAAGDEMVVNIPLVNDSLPEPLEDFFVHVGVRDRNDDQLVPVDTVRVDIVDDD